MTEVTSFPTATVEEVFNENLFNDPRHVLMQSGETITYNLNKEQQIWATIHFVIQENVAYSPRKSLFGAFEFRKKLGYDDLVKFYGVIEKSLAAKGVEKIIITLPANFCRKSRVKMMKRLLEESGFERLVKLKNHSIPVVEKHISSIIHPMEKRKLKKCNASGLSFNMEPGEMLPVIYEFIKLCRKEKKQPMSIEYDRLLKSFELFPGHYSIFTVKNNNEIFAATIAVKVNDKVLYNFLPASPVKFNDLSPTVKLLDGLYDYAYKQGFKYVDLGVSTTPEGKNQKTLIDFKKRMGGQKSSKVRYGKMLNDNPYWYA